MTQERYIVGLVGTKHYTVQHGSDRYDEERIVLYDGQYFLPYESLKVIYMTPDFDWGHSGFGCKQLALAILLQLIEKTEAVDLMDRLVSDCLSRFKSSKGFKLPIHAVEEWIEGKRRGEMPRLFETATIIDPNGNLNTLAAGVTSAKRKLPVMKEVLVKVKQKYPFAQMGIDECFFLFNEKEAHSADVIKSTEGQRLNRKFTGRTLSLEWAKENNIVVPEGTSYIYGIWRVK